MAYSTTTLTGTYTLFDGTPAQGVIEIIPSEKVVKDTTGDVILSGRVKVTLDAAGKFSVDLPSTDDATLNPTGFGYTLVAKLHHQHIAAVSFSLPAGTPVDIEDVTAVDPSTFTPDATYVQSGELAVVATTGAYADLTGQPVIPTTAAEVGALPDTTQIPATAADVGAEPAGLSQATQDTLAGTYTRLNPNALWSSTPVYHAHNAAPSEMPEESISAWRWCAEHGVGVKGNARMLYDGTLVAMHDATVDRTTLSAGSVYAHNAQSWRGVQVDAATIGATSWPVEYAPTWEQLLREFGNRMPMTVQPVEDGSGQTYADVLNAFDALVERIGVHKGTICILTASPDRATTAKALGYTTRVYGDNVTDPQLADPATAKAKGVDILSLSVYGKPTQAWIDAVHAEGLLVSCGTRKSYSEAQTLLAMGADMVAADAAVYVSNRDKFTRTTDMFGAQVRNVGHVANRGSFGVFTAPDEYGWEIATFGVDITALGYLAPTDPANYTIDLEANILGGASGPAYLWVSDHDRLSYLDEGADTPPTNGYGFYITLNGSLQGIRIANNLWAQGIMNTTATTGFSLNTWLPYRLTVTPTSLKWERTDTGESVTSTSATVRPLPYIHVGRSVCGVRFRNITVT